ncbi:beta-lactamase-like protein [Fusarium redolens]|uniref:Beta-lactamase-like protein n=1 Tax=Fusarium redolens TaxID=48865 RepID=A0A9P9H9K8_FUSRE|nr:beta-lactamase-like protein [Fusarium redolens]KAH7253456.1 beta-lactamase-like protein [Fusarium redolens]
MHLEEEHRSNGGSKSPLSTELPAPTCGTRLRTPPDQHREFRPYTGLRSSSLDITSNSDIMATQLIALPAVERLSPTVIRILGGNPGKFTLQGTNTYLLGTGRSRLLIDTGEGRNAWISSIRDTLQQENATIDTALITHWHHDHTGGIKDLLSISPQTRIFKHTPEEGQHEIKHGQRFQVDGATLTAAYTPGHTKDHMVFVLEEEDAMFTADNVLGHGTAVFEELVTYLRSLEEMKPLFKGRAYPGHGPVLENGPAKIAEYITHRKQREDQVIQTLKTGPGEVETQESALWSAWTATDLVEVIYKDVPQNLHPAARGGVLQILGKLESEGRIAHDGDQWKMLADGRASL